MYLSDRDLRHAVERGFLVIDPPPVTYEPSSVNLHLDAVSEARVWDAALFAASQTGGPPLLDLGDFAYSAFAEKFTKPIPEKKEGNDRVYRGSDGIIVEPGGFFLWQTREVIGTRDRDARYICFVDGRSTRARTGLLIHLTAPTIHACWYGKVTLEIANLGPFDLVLHEGDSVAQVVVAMLTSSPDAGRPFRGIPPGQQSVTAAPPRGRKKRDPR